ncbi:MAG TPA: DUF3592 domain-containing protein [Thermoanaerobaculia bacterium]|nr:DUF3592 domain-containing protein [Thermoanaerobaculia bacterium]
MQTLPVMLAPPPRRVPLSLAVVNLCNGAAQIGWFVFGFGMIFAWAFIGNADFSAITFRGPHAEAAGRLTEVAETGASENETPVVAHHYEFSAGGQRFTGTSYSTGGGGVAGDRVAIEYNEDDPARSRIAGMRRARFGPLVSLVGIFAFIGAVIVYFSTRSGVRRNHLLCNGALAMGTLVNKESTNMTVNDRRVYKLTFEFTARDGRRCQASTSTSVTARLEDDAQEALLYDPDQPDRAYLLDEAPGRPQFEMNGEMRGRPIAALASTIIPGIVIGVNVLTLAWRMGLVTR